MHIITDRLLASKRACHEQRDIFAAEWPDGAAVTLENCRRAVELNLDLNWLAQHFLSATAEKAYEEAMAPAWKAYEEATATALKAYREATAPALKAYQEAMAPAEKAYQEAMAPAEKAYQEATATAWKAYQEAMAPAEKAYQEATATAWKAYQEAKAPAFYDAWCIDRRSSGWRNSCGPLSPPGEPADDEQEERIP